MRVEENVCIDEQIIPFQGQLNIKQYIKFKPSPWGVKLYLLCGQSGLVLDLIAYQGATTPLNEQYREDFEVTGAITAQLSERILVDKKHKLYANNVFTSLDISKHLL